jgi:hypothetical protein
MKSAFLGILQFVCFLLVFLVASFWNPLHLAWFVSHPSPGSTRFFVPTGLFVMLLLYGAMLLGGAAAKRLRTAGIASTLAFVLALILGFLAKFGFVTR